MLESKVYMPKGVFCLEGDWGGLKDQTTVEPMLELLHNMHDRQVKYIHRNIATLQQFDYYMSKWTQQGQKNYPILYLGFHGMPNTIFVGDQRKVEGKITLEWIEERLAVRAFFCKRMDWQNLLLPDRTDTYG